MISKEELVELSREIKSVELKELKDFQKDDLLSIVSILDLSALVLDELTFVYNAITEEDNLIEPNLDVLIELFQKMKENLINGNALEVQSYIDRLYEAKTSTIKALSYLKTLKYFFKEEPRIILLN